MAERYRKIECRIWTDAKVRRLSPLRPSGQALWFYALTNPATTNIPGLYRAGEAAMAEELGWDLKGFRQAFAELLREGLAEADWTARVVWIPGVIKRDRPSNPNVVISWRPTWLEIPDCTLKDKAYSHLKSFVEGLGEPFAKAFGKSLARVSPNPLPNPEPEPDPEPDTPYSPPGGDGDAVGFDRWWEAYPLKVGKQAALRAWKKTRSVRPPTADMIRALSWQVRTREWRKDAGTYRPHPATYLNQGRWADEPPRAPASQPTSLPQSAQELEAKRKEQQHNMELDRWEASGFIERGQELPRDLARRLGEKRIAELKGQRDGQ